MINNYLQKFGFIEPQLKETPNPNVGLFVVIPCFDEPDLISSLRSLNNCDKPKLNVEIITVINSGKNTDAAVKKRNSETLSAAKSWAIKELTSRSEL